MNKFNSKDKNIWFTSDTHYSHKNVVKAISSWDDKEGCREFDTLEQHDRAMVDGINSVVGFNDILFHLGDWSFGEFEKIKLFKDRLICQNIHLILGNHDKHIEKNKRGIQGLFKSVDYSKEITIDGQKFVLLHYAMRVWNKSHRDSIHLYGHSHNSLEHEVWGKSMDAGVDSAYRILGEYRPFSFEEIKTIMKKREVKVLDHHRKK